MRRSRTRASTFIYMSVWCVHAAFAAALLALAGCDRDRSLPHEDLQGRPIAQLQAALESGAITSEALVRQALARIEALDRRGPALGAVISLNPQALEQAKALDRERAERGARGPLHGIPILIKDNIETADPIATTAGSLALAHNVTARDAPIVANLRTAGAVVLGKANLSEWANFRSEHSISGWSAVGGFTKNPHVLDRSPCGSSSGSAVAVAAGYVPASVGTETDGSITCPAAMSGVVGLKPTLGLLSARHIVPIAHSQDTAGPFGTNVHDVTVMLDAMVGSTPACQSKLPACRRDDYIGALAADALQGKRIGVLHFEHPRQPQIGPIYERALEILRAAGARLVDVREPDMKRIYAAEDIVLHVEFKTDLNAYLRTLPESVAPRSLTDLIAFNAAEPRELRWFGQEIFVKSNATEGLDDEVYLEALAASKLAAGPHGIDRLLAEHELDLLVAPTTGTAWRIDLVNGDHFPGSFSTLPAVAGYPHLTVPMGDVQGLPLGISFIGPAWSEATLLAAGFAFELRAERPPKAAFVPSIELASWPEASDGLLRP